MSGAYWRMMTNLREKMYHNELKICYHIRKFNLKTKEMKDRKAVEFDNYHSKKRLKDKSLTANISHVSHLFWYKSKVSMICQFISLTKNRIKRLPCALKGIVYRYEKWCCNHHIISLIPQMHGQSKRVGEGEGEGDHTTIHQTHVGILAFICKI